MVGISRVAIQMLETGKIKPSYDVLIKLLNLFGYDDPRKLFGDSMTSSGDTNPE
jgi:hypothetical protein